MCIRAVQARFPERGIEAGQGEGQIDAVTHLTQISTSVQRKSKDKFVLISACHYNVSETLKIIF